MAKKVGYEVVSTKPVCVDFRDGRTVSFRPGQRFEAALTNASVLRLLRAKEIRKLGMNEAVPALPIKLGAPRRVQNILKRRAEVDEAKKAALAKQAASKASAARKDDEPIAVIDLASLTKKSKKSTKSKPEMVDWDRPAEAE